MEQKGDPALLVVGGTNLRKCNKHMWTLDRALVLFLVSLKYMCDETGRRLYFDAPKKGQITQPRLVKFLRSPEIFKILDFTPFCYLFVGSYRIILANKKINEVG